MSFWKKKRKVYSAKIFKSNIPERPSGDAGEDGKFDVGWLGGDGSGSGFG